MKSLGNRNRAHGGISLETGSDVAYILVDVSMVWDFGTAGLEAIDQLLDCQLVLTRQQHGLYNVGSERYKCLGIPSQGSAWRCVNRS